MDESSLIFNLGVCIFYDWLPDVTFFFNCIHPDRVYAVKKNLNLIFKSPT